MRRGVWWLLSTTQGFLLPHRRPNSCCMFSSFNDDLIQRQKSKNSVNTDNAKEFLDNQQRIFDDMSEWFASDEAVPDNVRPVLKEFAETFLQNVTESLSILDVACGTGVLWEFLVEEAKRKDITLTITGVDLSPGMVGQAQTRAKTLDANITVVTSEVMKHHQEADVVIANACLGNFWDMEATLQHLCRLSRRSLFVTHPLGARFVKDLHEQDPASVPHELPSSYDSKKLPLQMKEFVNDNDGYYLAHLERPTWRFRGRVDSGFGRGGKKLGFPTANLDLNLPDELATGVYYGWARVEPSEELQKAVVNVGFSPTFAEQNPRKLVEAHLLSEVPDFYDQTMRLELRGYLRAERKFNGLDELVGQIKKDAEQAREKLDSIEPDHEFMNLENDENFCEWSLNM